MNAPIPATTLDGLRRRTRASQGRCQGFNCHAALVKTLEAGSKLPEIHRQQAVGLQSRTQVDVLIVGAGPAGLSAAIELKKLGVKNILVVDRESEAGGMPRLCHHTGFGREDLWRMWDGPKYANFYREHAMNVEVEIWTSTTITGWSETETEKSHSLSYTSPRGIGKITSTAVLLATGVRERPRSARLIPGTRPQGIYTTGSLQRFVYQEKLPVGRRAVIIGAELVSLSALLTLMHVKTKCVMMVTEEAAHQIQFPYITMKWLLADFITRTPIITNTRISNIYGRKQVEGIELTHEDGKIETVACDMVIFTGNWIPENELVRLGGLEMNPNTQGPLIDKNFHSSKQGIFVAGNLLRGIDTADHCAVEGKRAAKNIQKFLMTGN